MRQVSSASCHLSYHENWHESNSIHINYYNTVAIRPMVPRKDDDSNGVIKLITGLLDI